MADFQTPVGPVEKVTMALVQGQRLPLVGALFRMLAKSRGVQIPPQTFSRRPHLPHVGPIVVHELTRFGRGVTVFHGVTIGRGDIWREPSADFQGFLIDDHAVLCAGAAILSSHGLLTVGEGTIIGANSVLTQSTGSWEIWAGVPAKKVDRRRQ